MYSSLSPFLTHLPADTLLKEQNTQDASWFQKLETNGYGENLREKVAEPRSSATPVFGAPESQTLSSQLQKSKYERDTGVRVTRNTSGVIQGCLGARMC